MYEALCIGAAVSSSLWMVIFKVSTTCLVVMEQVPSWEAMAELEWTVCGH